MFQECNQQVTVTPIPTSQQHNVVTYALIQLKFTINHDLCIESLKQLLYGLSCKIPTTYPITLVSFSQVLMYIFMGKERHLK